MPDPPVIDRAAIQRLEDWGGEALFRKMIESFLSHAPERLEEIRDGVARHDARRAELGAHSLRSSAGNLGASRLQVLCEGAETMAEAGEFSALEGLLPELDQVFSDAREELERILEGKKG
jgi:HPt (histidine-containing phosphotransfer) domain-containing protein